MNLLGFIVGILAMIIMLLFIICSMILVSWRDKQ